MHLSQLREREQELKDRNVKVVIVTFEAGFLATQYLRETGLDWPLLVDEDRELYHGYGMLNASFWDVWGPKTWWVYLKGALKGTLPQKSDGDISQRGGNILVDPDGIVRLHHVGDGPADRPELNTVFSCLR